MRLPLPSLTLVTVATTANCFQLNPPTYVVSLNGVDRARIVQSLSSAAIPKHRLPQTSLLVATTSETYNDLSNCLPTNMPALGDDGVYELNNQDEHAALMEFASDKLVILKVYAPWCRACKGLAPKFQMFVNDPKYNENLPVIWASLSIQHSKAFVKSLGVIALPTIQFYVGGQLLETFGCGPSKVPIFKRKLTALINDHVDPLTRQLKRSSIEEAANLAELAAQRVKTEAEEQLELRKAESSQGRDNVTLTFTPEERKLFFIIPLLRELSLADFDAVLEKATLLTFQPGHIIVRQGRPGRHFFVIKSGEVEISQQTGAEDPLISSGYLGTIINRLERGDYFGERSLITGEPRMASVRATEPTICWAIDKDDFPPSSILSGKSKGLAKTSAALAKIDEKYGVDIIDHFQIINKQLQESSYANQVRGSVNSPFEIRGVDDDLSIFVVNSTVIVDDDDDDYSKVGNNDSNIISTSSSSLSVVPGMPSVTDDNAIFSLLTRFQMIRHAKTCFEYIVKSHARWGDSSVRKRRNLLANRLLPAQANQFASTFKLIDTNGDGTIELLELKHVLDLVDTNQQTDDKFLSKIMYNETNVNGDSPYLTFEDYMGLMAEAEFYNLFVCIFASLDQDNTGYVKAHELDRVLCGVRDLISSDQKSVIDVDDKDMSIDYDQFARMLLGI